MNKKIFGIRLGTILTVVICIIVAFTIWMTVKYKTSIAGNNSNDTAYVTSETL